MSDGFTLLEVATALVVLAILVILIGATVSSLRARAQRVQCTANLRSLYLAADSYLQQNGSWPQVPRDASGVSPVFADAWITALAPFNADRKTWICPTIQNLMHNPDYTNVRNARIDYIPIPFDDKPNTPHQWPRQPWFIEAGNVHGSGNLLIFTDGTINDLQTVLQTARKR